MTVHARMRIFEAVFPSFAETSAPTPSATPQLGSGSSGAPWGSFQEAKAPADDGVTESIRWDRAWHTATSFLSFPRAAVTREQALRKERFDESKWIKDATPGVLEAITYLVSEQSPGYQIRADREGDDLLQWYLQEVGKHYVDFELPRLLEVSSHVTFMRSIFQSSGRSYLLNMKHDSCKACYSSLTYFKSFISTRWRNPSAPAFVLRGGMRLVDSKKAIMLSFQRPCARRIWQVT